MALIDLFLLPGTLICKRLGISDEADEARLARSMFNTLVYTVVSLALLWAVVT